MEAALQNDCSGKKEPGACSDGDDGNEEPGMVREEEREHAEASLEGAVVDDRADNLSVVGMDTCDQDSGDMAR